MEKQNSSSKLFTGTCLEISSKQNSMLWPKFKYDQNLFERLVSLAELISRCNLAIWCYIQSLNFYFSYRWKISRKVLMLEFHFWITGKKNQNSIVKLNSKFREKTFLKHILFNRKNILSYVCIRNLSYLITNYLKPYSIYSNSHLCKRKYIWLVD